MTDAPALSPTPLLDALETLWRGRSDPGFDDAWGYVYQAVEEKREHVLWSFSQAVRDLAPVGAMTRLVKERRPFDKRFEGVAHNYVNGALRWAALDAARKERPPKPPPPRKAAQPNRRPALESVRATPEDMDLLFDEVIPPVLRRLGEPDFADVRRAGISIAALGQTLTELRLLADGTASVETDAENREAARKRYQRALKMLRLLVPEAWVELGWAPAGLFTPAAPHPPTLECCWAVAQSHASSLDPRVRQTLAAVVEISQAFHVTR